MNKGADIRTLICTLIFIYVGPVECRLNNRLHSVNQLACLSASDFPRTTQTPKLWRAAICR